MQTIVKTRVILNQAFNRVGIYLDGPCFSHGQLYITFSRAKRFQDVTVKVVNTSDQGNIKITQLY